MGAADYITSSTAKTAQITHSEVNKQQTMYHLTYL